MLFSADIKDLHGDGFKGSYEEYVIFFTKFFFGNDISSTNKMCLVMGVINFECEIQANEVFCR